MNKQTFYNQLKRNVGNEYSEKWTIITGIIIVIVSVVVAWGLYHHQQESEKKNNNVKSSN